MCFAEQSHNFLRVNTLIGIVYFMMLYIHVPGPPALITAGKATEPVAAWPTLFV